MPASDRTRSFVLWAGILLALAVWFVLDPQPQPAVTRPCHWIGSICVTEATP